MASILLTILYSSVMYGDWLMDMLDGGSADGNFTEVDNLTLTCAARNIQGPIPFSLTLATVVRACQSVFMLLLIFAGVFLNALVVVLVAKYKQLQTLSFLVSLQVIVLDLFLSVTLLASPITSIANRWLFGEYVCAVTGWLVAVTSLTRTLLMCVFVVDRYLAVFFPYFYPKHKLKVTVSLSVASWVFAVLVGIAMLPGLLDCYRFSFNPKLCGFSSQCNYPCSIFVRLYGAIAVPATVLPIVLYAVLYCKARKIRQAMNSDAAASDVYRREWKATITFSLLFITVFVLILPTTAIVVITVALTSGDVPSLAAYTVLSVNSCVVSLLVVTDPIVIMRDRDVKDILLGIKAAIFKKEVERPTEQTHAPTNVTDTINTEL